MRRERIPELDGFRVLAVFMVSHFHIWQQSWLRPGILGVDIEFPVRAGYVMVDATILLSGFLLFLPWVNADGPPESVGRFYRKRAARIMPSFLFVTLFMLFADALPRHLYDEPWRPDMAKDLITHITLTFPFFRDTFQYTPLGGASWTIAIEAHFYLLFPLLARLARKRPGWVLGAMTAAALYFRAWCLWTQDSYQMVVNQMANFLDVYALGMLCALIWPRLRALRDAMRKRRFPWRLLTGSIATTVFAGAVTGLGFLLKHQAGLSGYPAIQSAQMMLRPVFALCFALIILSLPLCLAPIRWLFGNPVTRFLGAISMNYYLLHQNVAVLLKTEAVRAWLERPRAWLGGRPILYSAFELPNQAYDHDWQVGYTLLCFGLSLAGAILVTFLIEIPFGSLIMFSRHHPGPHVEVKDRVPFEKFAAAGALPRPADLPASGLPGGGMGGGLDGGPAGGADGDPLCGGADADPGDAGPADVRDPARVRRALRLRMARRERQGRREHR